MTIRPRPDGCSACGALPVLRGAAAMVLLLLATACAASRQALPGAPRRLPADSLALLEAAIERARPAYPTQAEAIRAGVYAEGRLARERKRAEEGARVAAVPTPTPAEPLRETPGPVPEPRVELPAATPAPASVSAAGGATREGGSASRPPEADGAIAPDTAGAPAGMSAGAGVPTRHGATAPETTGGRFVIQIGAFPEPALALAAAENASLRFAGTEPVIEWAGGVYRAAIGAWRSRDDAASRLTAVREAYPDAWIRERPRQ